MAWVLTPALVKLRDTFNRLAPSRDKASDGAVGNLAHAQSVSSHNPDETGAVPIHDADTVNEVHAIDVDETGPWPTDARGQFTMMRAVRQLIEDHRAGRENRLRYIIYESTIWSGTWGWGARDYTGANPHDKHAHFDGSYDTARERDTSPWNIGYVEDEMTPEELRVAALGGFADALKLAAAQADADAATDPGPTGRQIAGYLRTLITTPLLAAINQVDEQTAEAVLTAIGDVETPPEETADLLRAALGDRAEAVGRALLGQ
jgi:hypothetical protein